jgi:hypothetical protein
MSWTCAGPGPAPSADPGPAGYLMRFSVTTLLWLAR